MIPQNPLYFNESSKMFILELSELIVENKEIKPFICLLKNECSIIKRINLMFFMDFIES